MRWPLCRVAVVLSGVFCQPISANPVQSWAVGDSWQVVVELFPAQSASVGRGEAKGENSAREPNPVTYEVNIVVHAKDGWPRKAFSFRDYSNLPLESFGDARALTFTAAGYPIEFFPQAGAAEERTGAVFPSLKLRITEEGHTRVATLHRADGKAVTI